MGAIQAVCLYGEYYWNQFLKCLSSGTMIIDEEVREKEDESEHCLKSGKTEKPENSMNNEYKNNEEPGRIAKWNHKVFDGSPDWSIPLIPERDENLCSSLFKLEIEENNASKKNVTGIRNSCRLEKLCVELTGNCAINQVELEGKEISHGDSSFHGSNTAAQSEEGLNMREAEEESLPVVQPFPQTAKEFSRSPASLPYKLPENENTSRSEINVETSECTIIEGVGASDENGTAEKEGEDLKTNKNDLFRKKEKGGNTNRSEYGAAKLDEGFSFRHHRSLGSLLLQCVEVFGKVIFACSSVPFCYLLLPALFLWIPISNGACLVGTQVDIKIKLNASAICNTQEIPISCENGEFAVCLPIVFENLLAWGCAPDICINAEVCAEFRETSNGFYVQGGSRNCMTCPGHYRLSEWKKFPECYNRTEQYPINTIAPATVNNTVAPPAENTQTLSPGTIAGIVIAVLVPVGILIAAIVYCAFCIRRQTRPTCLSPCRPSCCNTNPTNEHRGNEEQSTPIRENEQNGTTVQLENVDQNDN